MSDARTFYYQSLVQRCSVHRDNPAQFEIRSSGERFRYACSESCAKRQVADLEKVWAIGMQDDD